MEELNLFKAFVKSILREAGFAQAAAEFELTNDECGYEVCARILQELNNFLYVADPAIGRNPDWKKDYISRFHKFWRKHHQRIINPSINDTQCRRMAQILETIHTSYSAQLGSAQSSLFVTGNTGELSSHQIANVRFFTITQDFRIKFQIDPYFLASSRPNLFDARQILDDYPAMTDALLHELGAETQTDKRHKFSRLSAEFLVENYGGEAFNICQQHNGRVVEIREALVNNPNPRYSGQLGFSDKKANLLIRDLVAMRVWSVSDPEEIDVSSDANTMRIALRTGILKTRSPLMTSYLDVYDYQYGLIDEYTKRAWRRVWELWGTLRSNHRVVAPAMFDFLIYRIGQNCCKAKTRRCETNCNTGRLSKCPLRNSILTRCSGTCGFRDVCESATKKMNPPRAISVLGGTGWEDGRADEGGGKGISS